MKQQAVFYGMNQQGPASGNKSEGFITVVIIPLFMAILVFATAITGYISCSIHAMAHRNEMMQAYSLLEDDDVDWQEKALPGERRTLYEEDYEKVVSTQKAGPYVILVKEIRNKITGKVLVNRLEFIPIEKTNGQTS